MNRDSLFECAAKSDEFYTQLEGICTIYFNTGLPIPQTREAMPAMPLRKRLFL
jgi:hypothetical protein